MEEKHIETIARGVCVKDGKVLLCLPKDRSYSYLPGGHIEFGETGREALVREMKEETGRDATAGGLLGVVESSFVQKGERHCEINLIYEMKIREQGTGNREQVRVWRVVYDPVADDCFLLSPDSNAEIPSGAWVTVLPLQGAGR